MHLPNLKEFTQRLFAEPSGGNYRLGKNHSLEIYKIIAGLVPDHLNKETISK